MIKGEQDFFIHHLENSNAVSQDTDQYVDSRRMRA